MSALEDMDTHPAVDLDTADEVAFKREDGTRVTVGEVAAAQARLLDLIHKHARDLTRSNNPGRRAAGADLLELLGRG